jgi:purine-binding chemotaxis protein CheW
MSKQRIDWAEVKRRLDDSQQALERVLAPSAADLGPLYLQRAALLAQRRRAASVPADSLRALVFTLGAERYALEFAYLVELLPFANCTPVPGGPPALLGVINVHGEIRSVVDMGRLLDVPTGTAGYVLLLRHQGRQVGLRVDSIEHIRLLAPGEIAAPGDSETDALPFLRGLTPDRVRVLRTDALLDQPLFRATTS